MRELWLNFIVCFFVGGQPLPAIEVIAEMTRKAITKVTTGARESRLLVYMSNAQRKSLRTLARRTETSQQALIRRGIDLVLKVKP